MIFLLGIATGVRAATNISAAPTEHWAWNDLVGWINLYEMNNVMVQSSQLYGDATSSAGIISLNCTDHSACGSSNYKVLNDGMGNLSGWAWNDVYGWFSFCGGQDTAACPGASSTYQIKIDPLTGIFTDGGFQRNYAWNDIIGWTSFNCDNQGAAYCSSISNYKVVTTWIATSAVATLDSATLDSGAATGAQLNSVLWQGDLPVGTYVRFQFAGANAPSGPWNYIGPDGTANTYYDPGAANTSLPLDYTSHMGYRYYRYRVELVSDQAQTVTPRVDDIVVNWSP